MLVHVGGTIRVGASVGEFVLGEDCQRLASRVVRGPESPGGFARRRSRIGGTEPHAKLGPDRARLPTLSPLRHWRPK